VKVILSLREDYLYYLLECNNRLISLEVINNNILDKNILYYLGNFSVEDAKSVIQSLTEQTHFSLEPALIDALVQDLAGELGEVRPIELQVVGAQLQTEKIAKLEQYREHGPKDKLVGRFLEEVVKDCGSENELTAKLVLYLLTDENNTRPLKTRADLELELDVTAEKLDLVLEIFVKSRLVFQVPALPVERYQLVHDYLVAFVRQQQSARLVAELEKEREQRKLTEAKLNEVLKQQLEETRRGLVWKVTLGVIAGGLAIFLPLVLTNQNNTQLSSMSTKSQGLLKSDQDLDALVESLKAGKRLQKWSIGVKLETKMQVVTALQDVVNSIRERNRLLGHTDIVTCVSFSPDSQRVVSGSGDGTIKLWSREGKEIKPFKGHEKKITSINFSPNGQRVISGSEDGTIKLWNLDGKELASFKGDQKSITSLSFSSNAQRVVSGSEDGTMKLWSLDGKEFVHFKGHEKKITSISFSPDGKTLASSSEDRTVKLWSFDGEELNTLRHEYLVTSVTFSHDGQIIASLDGYYLRLWRSDGSLLKTIPLGHSSGGSLSFSSEDQTIASAGFSENTVYPVLKQIHAKKLLTHTLKGHKNKVTSVSLSPDGKILASASEDNTVKLWNLDNRNFQTPDNSKLTSVKFSPDGQIVASISENKQVQLWQRDGTLRTTLPGRNSEASFSADSRLLVSASQDSTVQLWRRDGTFLKTLQGELVGDSFSPDGRTIALVKDNHSVELWNSEGTKITTVSGHKAKVYWVGFSPDGKTFATASEDKSIKLWRRNGTPIATFQGYSDPINNIGFSPNSETLAIWGGDNTVKFMRRNGKVIRILTSDQDLQPRFSPDGQIVAIDKLVDDKSQVQVWRIDGTLLTTLTLQEQGETRSTSFWGFSSNSQIIVTLSDDGKWQFWNRNGARLPIFDKGDFRSYSPNVQTLVTFQGKNKVKLWKPDGTPTKTIQVKNERLNLKQMNDNYSFLTFSPDSQILAIRTDKNTVELWRIDGTFLATIPGVSDGEIERLRRPSNDSANSNLPMSFSSDSQTFAIRTANNALQFWRIGGKASSKGLPSKMIKGKGNWVGEVRSIPNSEILAVVGGNDTVKLWQLPPQPGKEARLLQTFKGHSDQVTNVSINPDAQLIASASADNTVKLWRRDGTLATSLLKEHTKKINSVSFSPDGQFIASASNDKTVKVWRRDGKVIKSFEEHGNGVNSVSFSPDGKLIASASQDTTVKLWSLDGKPSKTLNNEESVLRVSFSPDGQLIASATKTTVKLWNVDGTLITTFQRFGSQDVNFSPDPKEQTLAAAGNEGVAIWNFDLNDLLKRGCDAARDYLKYSLNVKQSDRTRCDGIGTQK
jgi:WD40 repeat protein